MHKYIWTEQMIFDLSIDMNFKISIMKSSGYTAPLLVAPMEGLVQIGPYKEGLQPPLFFF